MTKNSEMQDRSQGQDRGLELAGTRLDDQVWICSVQYGILAQTGAGAKVASEEGTDEGEGEKAGAETETESGAKTGEESGTEADEEEGEAKPAVVAPVEDWRERRLKEQTAKRREAERRAADLEAELAQYRTGNTSGAAAGASGATEPDLDQLVEARAAERAAVAEFNRQCNEVAASGQEEFGQAEFNSRVQALTGLVDRGDPQEAIRYNQFLVAAIETGDAPKLLHQLGGDLNEAARIMALSPVKMAVELTKLAAKAPAAEVSGAPKPIRPLATGGTRSHEAIAPDDPDRGDRLTTREWMQRREAQLASRNGARR